MGRDRDYEEVQHMMDELRSIRSSLAPNVMTEEEYAEHRKSVRAEQLAQMATTLAAGMFQRDPRGQGYHVHNEADRMNVARVSVEMARRILAEIDGKDDVDRLAEFLEKRCREARALRRLEVGTHVERILGRIEGEEAAASIARGRIWMTRR